jgi:lipopolysaccharide transport system permease protein
LVLRGFVEVLTSMSAPIQVPHDGLHTRLAAPEEILLAKDGPESTELPRTVIEPARAWQLINVRELWAFRELIGFLIWRDVKIRYKQTVLGAAWAILQPTMMMIVMTILFKHMAHVSSGDQPYEVFVYAGLLPWTFFAAAIANAANSVVGAERLITKVYFPRLAIPFSSVGAAVVDFAIAFGLLLILMAWNWQAISPGPGMLLLPLIFAIILLAALGVSTLFAALTVAYRDFRYVVPVMIQVWMFATPTIYLQPEEGGSGLGQLLLNVNPMASLIAAFRACCLGGPIPWGQVAVSSVVVVIVFLAGCFYYRKVEDSFADII